MKNKLLVGLGVLLILSLFIIGCLADGDSGSTGGSGSTNDPFSGTWVSTDGEVIIKAGNGAWSQYQDGVELIRGTYSYSGNTVSGIIKEVNPFIYGRTGPWIKYSDLTANEKTYLMGNTDSFSFVVNNNTITAMGITMIKQ